jgi:hypothetical protein
MGAVSTTLGLDFVSPTIYRDLQTLEPQAYPHTACMPLAALPPTLPSLGAPAVTPPHTASHRMWSAMDSPLLRNIYSVLFAKHESLELLTKGRGRAA